MFLLLLTEYEKNEVSRTIVIVFQKEDAHCKMQKRKNVGVAYFLKSGTESSLMKKQLSGKKSLYSVCISTMPTITPTTKGNYNKFRTTKLFKMNCQNTYEKLGKLKRSCGCFCKFLTPN